MCRVLEEFEDHVPKEARCQDSELERREKGRREDLLKVVRDVDKCLIQRTVDVDVHLPPLQPPPHLPYQQLIALPHDLRRVQLGIDDPNESVVALLAFLAGLDLLGEGYMLFRQDSAGYSGSQHSGHESVQLGRCEIWSRFGNANC